jgi:predicted RNA binding protein YcfA (HicA-like mRNA interferase family)
MSRLPDVSGAELVKALQKAGFLILRQKGSHVSMEKVDSAGQWRTIVPMHREIARGTLHDILKQTGLSRDELRKLLRS